MGIVGFGAIGQAVARRAKAFDMRVLAIRRNPQPDPLADEVHGPEAFQAILPDCDVVVLAAPSNTETRDMFDAEMLEAMQPGAIFCNVARGALVDEGALVAALRSGHVGAAILDVTKQEPLPSASLLWDCPNLHLSPHSAPSLDTFATNVYELFIENLGRYLRQESLVNQIGTDQAPYR